MREWLDKIPIAMILGIVQLALGCLVLLGKSQEGIQFEQSTGITAHLFAGMLIGAGISLVFWIRCHDVLFTIVSLPYMLYVALIVRVVFHRQANESTLIIGAFSVVLLFSLFTKENGYHG